MCGYTSEKTAQFQRENAQKIVWRTRSGSLQRSQTTQMDFGKAEGKGEGTTGTGITPTLTSIKKVGASVICGLSNGSISDDLD